MLFFPSSNNCTVSSLSYTYVCDHTLKIFGILTHKKNKTLLAVEKMRQLPECGGSIGYLWRDIQTACQ